MALCVRTPLVTAQKVSYKPDGVLKTPVVGFTSSGRRFVARHDQMLTKRSNTSLNAYHPVKPLPTRRTPSRRSEVNGEQHMTLTTQPPRNKREVAEGVWAYIMLGGLLFSGMIFVLPEFSMAIPLIFKAFGGQ